jgi:hypothetical protein
LSVTGRGDVRYALKTPYRDGTTHVIFEPLDFLARLAALVPIPGVNLTRFHGVFAPHHALRAQIVPGRRQAGEVSPVPGQGGVGQRAAALGWAQRLKRVFALDVERCEGCGAGMRIIACIEEEQLIEKILTHLGIGEFAPTAPTAHLARAGPLASDLFE